MIDLTAVAWSEHRDGARLTVKAKPRASRTKIAGVQDGALVVALAAPPVDGEANAELIRALAEWFDLPARDVTIVTGHGGRRKIVALRTLDGATARARLAAALGRAG